MTLLLQIIVPLIFALYLFTIYRNNTIGKAAFLLAVIIGIFGLENIFQYASLMHHAVYPYWGSLKAVVIILSVVFLFKRWSDRKILICNAIHIFLSDCFYFIKEEMSM